MSRYSESAIRRKAKKLGYIVQKGFVHYLGKGYPVWTYWNGAREVGYNVIDTTMNTLVWGCYDSTRDHLWSLEDVEAFLTETCAENGMTF